MTTHPAYHPRRYGDPAFDNGVLHDISWHLTGDEEYRQPTSQLIVDFIRDNILEPNREGFLDENRLIDNVGFLVAAELTARWGLGKARERFRGQLVEGFAPPLHDVP